MLSKSAIGLASAVLIGMTVTPASAADTPSLREISAAAQKRVTAEPARQAELVSGED